MFAYFRTPTISEFKEMELDPLCFLGMPKNACYYFYNKSNWQYYEYRSYDKQIRNVTFDFNWIRIRKSNYMEVPLVSYEKIINICGFMFCWNTK